MLGSFLRDVSIFRWSHPTPHLRGLRSVSAEQQDLQERPENVVDGSGGLGAT